MFNIPSEIKTMIIDYLNDAEILQCTLVCKSWLTTCSPRRYRTMAVISVSAVTELAERLKESPLLRDVFDSNVIKLTFIVSHTDERVPTEIGDIIASCSRLEDLALHFNATLWSRLIEESSHVLTRVRSLQVAPQVGLDSPLLTDLFYRHRATLTRVVIYDVSYTYILHQSNSMSSYILSFPHATHLELPNDALLNTYFTAKCCFPSIQVLKIRTALETFPVDDIERLFPNIQELDLYLEEAIGEKWADALMNRASCPKITIHGTEIEIPFSLRMLQFVPHHPWYRSTSVKIGWNTFRLTFSATSQPVHYAFIDAANRDIMAACARYITRLKLGYMETNIMMRHLLTFQGGEASTLFENLQFPHVTGLVLPFDLLCDEDRQLFCPLENLLALFPALTALELTLGWFFVPNHDHDGKPYTIQLRIPALQHLRIINTRHDTIFTHINHQPCLRGNSGYTKDMYRIAEPTTVPLVVTTHAAGFTPV